MAEIKEKFYAKSGNFEPDKCNAYSVISRVDYEAIMQRIIQLQDKTIKKEKRDYWIISRFDVLEVNIEGQNIRKLVKKGTELRYVCQEVKIKIFSTYLTLNFIRIYSI